MTFGLNRESKTTPFAELVGRLVSYNTQAGNITGVYRGLDLETVTMVFKPSIGFTTSDTAYVEKELPFLTTIPAGIMRPLRGTIEELAEGINSENSKPKKA